jgi:aryl-alcohol dehydrogenase-like predicted oxidoreductase
MGVGLIPWSPLARGLLTGTRTREDLQSATTRARSDEFAHNLFDDADFDIVDVLQELSKERGLPPAQIALAWLLHKPGVTAPIVGATKDRHIDDAVAAVGITLTESEILRLEAPYQPHSIRGHA